MNNLLLSSDRPERILKKYTHARIALGHTGNSIPIKHILDFKMAHAHARDAVYAVIDKEIIFPELLNFKLGLFELESLVASREQYLQRPDYGRKLSNRSVQILKDNPSPPSDVAIIVGDGLSAAAVNRNILPLLELVISQLQHAARTIAPLIFVNNARVAISDEIGSLLHAKLSLILIGERPGLSSPDSLGAYLTYQPKVGLTDDSRNCISNIRPEGLSYAEAAASILYLINESIRRQLSGVHLKDNSSLTSS